MSIFKFMIVLKIRFMRIAKAYIILTLIISSLKLEGQWVIKNLDELSYTYETIISFKNDSIGLMMGNNSVILKSNDIGETWNTVEINTQVNLKDFQFLTNSIVYAIGDHYVGAGSDMKSKLIKSLDDGDTWDSITCFPGLQLKSLCFLNNDTGMIAGFKAILRTEDGGISWDTVWKVTNSGFKYGEVVDIAFPEKDIGYAIGVGRSQSDSPPAFDQFILKTIDTGLQWDTISSFDHVIESLFFLNRDTGYIGDEMGNIHKTVDGGLTWAEFSIGAELPVFSVQFISEQVGFATGSQKYWPTKGGLSTFHISKTIDGGENWETYDTTGIPLQSIHFINDSIGFVSGLHSLIMKSNGQIAGLPENYPWHLVIFGHNEETSFERELVNVYPNPTTGEISIRLSKPANHPAKIELYSITGQWILTDQIDPGKQLIRLDITNQKGSIFILKIETESGPYTNRVIKIN